MSNSTNAASDRPRTNVADLWKARYRAGNSPQIDLGHELIDVLLSHRTVRAYLPQPLPEGALELAIAAAQSAPTTSNLQPWSVVAITDPDLKRRVSVLASDQKQTAQAPVLLVFLADLHRLREAARLQEMTSDGLDYLECFVFAVLDAALAAQNAVVALEAMGLGTCFIGAIRNNADKVAAELNLPEEVFPVVGLTVGIPDPAYPADVKPRLPQHMALHRNGYQKPMPEDLRGYDRTLQTFQAEQAMPLVDWTRQTSIRVGSADALHNRHRLREFITGQGFKLK